MEPENENVEPTRSLFGGPVPAAEPVPEDGSLGVDAGNTESAAVKEDLADPTQPVDEVALPQEVVTNEQEQKVTEPEETLAPVEVGVEEGNPEPVVEEEAVAVTTSFTEDTPLTTIATEAEAAPATELPGIAKLKAEREKLDAVIQNKQLEERKSVISQIAAVVKLYDIPLLELFTSLGGIPNPRKGEKAPITHKDDQGNTWTGRGRTPRWLKDKNPDDYRVK